VRVCVYRSRDEPEEVEPQEQTCDLQSISIGLEKNLKCTSCAHIAKSASSLNIHIRAKHDKIRNHTCSKCANTYLHAHSLKAHKKYKHGLITTRRPPRPNYPRINVPSYPCSICDITTNCQAQLKAHVSGVHQNLRRFPCPSCAKTYKYSNGLNHHRMMKHDYFIHRHHIRDNLE
jgi:hypothetical protein